MQVTDVQKHLAVFSGGLIWDEHHYQGKGQPQVPLLTIAFASGKLRIASPAPVTLQDGNPDVLSQSTSLSHVAAALIWELLICCRSACIISCKHTFNY